MYLICFSIQNIVSKERCPLVKNDCLWDLVRYIKLMVGFTALQSLKMALVNKFWKYEEEGMYYRYCENKHSGQRAS